MKTIVLKLEEKAIGNFEKLGRWYINLTKNNNVGVVGALYMDMKAGNITSIIGYGVTFFSDSSATISIGTKYLYPNAGRQTIYVKVIDVNPYVEFDNLYNIQGIGGANYIFGSGNNLGGIINTSDFYKFENIKAILIERSGVIGNISEIPEQITDCRLDNSGIVGDLSEFKPTNLNRIRLRERSITGTLSNFSNKRIVSFLEECPNVTGDIKDLLNITDLVEIAIGNTVGTIAVNLPITVSINENIYFTRLTSFFLRGVAVDRTTLLNILKSLTKTIWSTGTVSGVSLVTTMSESDYNSDSEIQTAVTNLKSVLVSTYAIAFV